jgi:opacity protein-like surface antigen
MNEPKEDLVMQKREWIAAALVSSGLIASGTAGAAGIYAGASVGQTTIQEEFNGFDFDETETGWKLFAGTRFGLFGVEGGYVNFGDASAEILGTDIDVGVDGFDLFGTANLNLGPATLFAKLGGIAWNTDVDVGGISGDEDGTDLAYGVGASFNIAPATAVRAEYERFELGGIDDLDMLSAGFEFTF